MNLNFLFKDLMLQNILNKFGKLDGMCVWTFGETKYCYIYHQLIRGSKLLCKSNWNFDTNDKIIEIKKINVKILNNSLWKRINKILLNFISMIWNESEYFFCRPCELFESNAVERYYDRTTISQFTRLSS